MARVKGRIANIFGRRSESGTAAIEFAMFAPILIILLGGAVDFGYAAFEWMQVNNLVEAQTLYVAQNASALYYAAPFSPTVITSAVGNSGSTSCATATPAPTRFCSCPLTTGMTTGTAFAAPPADPCSAALTCNGNTSAQSAYVLVSASCTHTAILHVSWWTNPTFTSRALVRIH